MSVPFLNLGRLLAERDRLNLWAVAEAHSFADWRKNLKPVVCSVLSAMVDKELRQSRCLLN